MKEQIVKHKEIILYCVFGVLTTLVNFLAYYVFVRLFGIQYIVSNWVAWFLSIVFAYITNKLWVFESESKNIFREFILFAGSRLTTGLLETLLLYVLVGVFLWDNLWAKIVCGVIVIIFNYVFSKVFVFKK